MRKRPNALQQRKVTRVITFVKQERSAFYQGDCESVRHTIWTTSKVIQGQSKKTEAPNPP